MKEFVINCLKAQEALTWAKASFLRQSGDKLHLKKDLFKNTQTAVNEILTEIKNNTSN